MDLKQKKGEVKSGGERGIRTLDTGFPVYSLSRRAPSATRPSLRINLSCKIRNVVIITPKAKNQVKYRPAAYKRYISFQTEIMGIKNTNAHNN
jgi:hypothetical protein